MSDYGFTVGLGGYDDEDRLVNWERADTNLDQSWNLSLVGNWNSITENASQQNRTHGPTHELLTVASQSVTHDAKGNMTLIPAVLRPGSDPLKMKWDFENKLRAADIDDDGIDDIFYKFDALGRRVARDDGTDHVIYYQVGQQTLADYPAGTAAASPTYTYVYASYIDEPVMRGGSGGLRYYHRNQQYSITALTDGGGSIVERYVYTAYGQVTFADAGGTVQTASAITNRHTYTGREWDEGLSLYHFRARMYDAVAGRFVSRDPTRYSDGMSMFRNYFQLHGLDPSGLSLVLPDERDRDHQLNLLNQLCPEGGFLAGSDGYIISSLGTCLGPSSTHPHSCNCIAAAINSPCTIEIRRARRSIGDIAKGIPPTPRVVGDCCNDGKVTVYISEPIGIVVGTPVFPENYPALPLPPPPFADPLPGVPEQYHLPNVPLPTDEFIVLGHELCGHAVTGWRHPPEGDPTRYTCDDPVIKVENCIRKEHSTPDCDYGKRYGHVPTR